MPICLNCTCGKVDPRQKACTSLYYYNDVIILLKYNNFFVLDYIEITTFAIKTKEIITFFLLQRKLFYI